MGAQPTGHNIGIQHGRGLETRQKKSQPSPSGMQSKRGPKFKGASSSIKPGGGVAMPFDNSGKQNLSLCGTGRGKGRFGNARGRVGRRLGQWGGGPQPPLRVTLKSETKVKGFGK